MEENLRSIREISSEEGWDRFDQLSKAGAIFQPDNNNPGKYSVIWKNTLADLAGSQAVARELASSQSQELTTQAEAPTN